MTTAPLDSRMISTAPARSAVAVGLSRFPTVTETFILREVVELERQGQPVRLVPMIRENPPIVHEAARPWTQRALYTPFLSLPIVAANLRAFLRRPFRYAALFARLVAGTLAAPRTLIGTLALFPKSVYLARRLEQEGVGHIHVHYASHPATMALIISKLADVTFSFTVHAHDIQTDRSLLRWKIAEARFIRSISAYNRRFLEGLYPKEAAGKIDVIHVGIEPENYENNVAVTGATPRILCVAAHKPYKGLPVLIEAARILRDDGVAFVCNLVGHGPMHDELEAMIRARGLGDRVHLIGARPEDEVTRMMTESTLFVLPSIVDPATGMMEGIPVALMEAMASGRPVVSTKTAGIPELVDDGVNGLLVEAGDAEALAAAIRSILADPHRARSMGERGREKVRREFDLRTCVAQLLARLDAENRGPRP
jgi:colanic acid/amylovoran biosynthesis glycosyltransferase